MPPPSAPKRRLTCSAPRLTSVDTRIAKPPRKVAEGWYSTPEHKAWSQAVIERDGSKCRVCGSTARPLYADHIVEIKDGGEKLSLPNGQCLCAKHHGIKTAAERARRLGPAG